jgi:Rv0078B-related antitoxin
MVTCSHSRLVADPYVVRCCQSLTHVKAQFIDHEYHESMSETGGLWTLFARLAGLRAAANAHPFDWSPEADRMRSALEMHELGVQLYRQRMRREHPYASRADIDDLVRAWLVAPPPDTRLRLPSRERHGFAG